MIAPWALIRYPPLEQPGTLKVSSEGVAWA